MERVQRSNKLLILGVVALTSLSLLAIGSMSWVLHAAEENSAKSERAEGENAAEKWTVTVAGDGACDAACEKRLYLQRQLGQSVPFVAFDRRLLAAAQAEGLPLVMAAAKPQTIPKTRH